MAGDCRLAEVQQVGVQFSESQVTIRVAGVALESGEVGRIDAVMLGHTMRFQVLACADPEAAPSRRVDLVAQFPRSPDAVAVIVEHGGGQETFEVDRTQVCSVCGTANPASRRYCRHCGNELRAAEVGMASAPPEPLPTESSAPPPPMSTGLPNPVRSVTRGLRDLLSSVRGSGASARPVADEPAAAPEMAAPEMAADEPVAMAADGAAPAPDAAPPPGYPRLDAPPFVIVGTPADITIGVAPTQDPQVGGGALQPPPTAGDTYILSVQLIADGFSLADGSDTWEWDLAVTPRQPHPSVTVRVVADPIQERARAAVLRVLYTVQGQVIGQAERALAVVGEGGAAEEVELPDVAVRRAMALPVGATPADLTVVILADKAVEGRLLWAFRTPHAIGTPKRDRITSIGRKAEAFADEMRKQAEQSEAGPMLRNILIGIGRQIAAQVDTEFWRLFKEVREAVGERPSILFLLEEPYVPWELAVLPESDFPGEPRFVAAEAVTGRWVLTGGPKLPPPELVEMKAMAVVYGEYATARLAKLAEAEEEARQLSEAYGATSVHATLEGVQGVLAGQPSAEVLHFAIHGRFNSAGADLLMEDGQPLTSTAILGSDLASGPFVFLNACQVGAANELLGSYAGLVAAFTVRGAAAAVAPLWKVSDSVAKDLSLSFYQGAFGGERPAELLRQQRAAFAQDAAPVSATPMAYQFYGHPAFRLTRSEGPHA